MTRFSIGLALLLAALVASAVPARADRDVRTPGVKGLELAHALRLLESVDLRAEVVWTAEGRPGYVHAQHPDSGERVPAGSVVELQVARRLEIETIVPDVVGMAEDEAVAALEDVYVLEIEERLVRPALADQVVEQDPRARVRVPFRGVLRLTVGRARRLGHIEFPLPDLSEMTLDEAEGALLDLGLIPVPTFVRARPGIAGRVRRQDPRPATLVTHGARVELEIALSDRPALRVRVPSLYGLDPTEAAQTLAALGLGARIERLPSRFETDTVVRQQPEAGTAATPGSAIRLTVAVPAAREHVPARVGVPDLTGVSLVDAFARARRAGVRLDVRRREERGQRGADAVLSQSPTAHVAVPLGTRVRVEVPAGTRVPDLVGLTPDAAALRIWEAGLRLVFAGDPRARFGALIVSQAPEAGARVDRGSTVRALLRGDSGMSRVLVPDVRGLTASDASTRLRAAGLEGRFIGPVGAPGARTRVVTQNPDPGTTVPRATIVDVTYQLAATGADPVVVVPDLSGMTLDEARRQLTSRGLIGVVSLVRGPGPKGVTGQSPAPGTRVRRGAQVAFTVRR